MRSPRPRVCIFDDIIEYANEGGAATKYLEAFLPTVLGYCVDKNSDVRQASVYGVGVCARAERGYQNGIYTGILAILHRDFGHFSQ